MTALCPSFVLSRYPDVERVLIVLNLVTNVFMLMNHSVFINPVVIVRIEVFF